MSLVLLLVLAAQSQPPTPTPAMSSREPQSHSKAGSKESEAESGSTSPGPTTVNSTGESVADTYGRHQQAPKQDQKGSLEWWGDIAMVISTVVMAVFTGLLWWIARIQTKSTHAVERAYIALSHEPPGLDISSLHISGTGQSYQTQDATLCMVVNNHGSTPGSVSEAFVKYHIGVSLPPIQEWGKNTIPQGGFLAPSTGFRFERTYALMTRDLEEVRAGKKRLWILGYVDYMDRFGQRHRSLYARRYDPGKDQRHAHRKANGQPDQDAWNGRNNLEIETKPGYNDDRARKKYEGIDWGTTSS